MKTLLTIPGVRQHESLARFTAARLGGPAEMLYVARDSVETLAAVVSEAWTAGLPVHILGGGANVLISDRGLEGLVVINHVSDVQFGDWHDGRNMSTASGTGLATLARKCAARGLAGFEWAINVPGTVGGAVVNNAGAHGGAIADNVADVVVLEAARGPQLYTAADLAYDYRASALKERADKRFLVLLATFTLTPDDPAAIDARMAKFTARRKQTQPPGASLGSIFKNPPGDYAGRLIEAAGLKGWQVGGAQVSPVHANFFINTGGATARDYLDLIAHVRETVLAQTGITLELEIEVLGEDV
jgi:UDP-N-acetylmuramate dehydrogenase